MATQFDALVRNAMLNAIETAIGASPTMRLRTGAKPANAAAADTGTVVATLALPADWLADAASGVKALSGTWSDAAADSTGSPGHFRIYDSGGTCKMQGTVTATGGGGDLTLDDITVDAGQTVNVTSFSITGGNA